MKNWILGALATAKFELIRSFTLQRVAVSGVLFLFPPVMLTLIILAPGSRTDLNQAFNPVMPFVTFAMIFLVALVCVLSLLLWATPNIQNELEGKSWSFIAMRPGGRVSCYLGKFLTAVLTSYAVSMFALTGCVLIANRYSSLGNGIEPLQTWLALAVIYGMACFAYGAIFSFLGTIFTKRAMVVGAIYMVGVETLMSAIPAIISRFTMSYHLRRLGEKWLGWFLPSDKMEMEMLFGPPGPNWFHIGCVLLTGLLFLIAGGFIVVNRQFISSEEA